MLNIVFETCWNHHESATTSSSKTMKDAQPAFRGSEPLHQGKPRLIHWRPPSKSATCGHWGCDCPPSKTGPWLHSVWSVKPEKRGIFWNWLMKYGMFDRHKFGNWHLNKRGLNGPKHSKIFQTFSVLACFSWFPDQEIESCRPNPSLSDGNCWRLQGLPPTGKQGASLKAGSQNYHAFSWSIFPWFLYGLVISCQSWCGSGSKWSTLKMDGFHNPYKNAKTTNPLCIHCYPLTHSHKDSQGGAPNRRT